MVEVETLVFRNCHREFSRFLTCLYVLGRGGATERALPYTSNATDRTLVTGSDRRGPLQSALECWLPWEPAKVGEARLNSRPAGYTTSISAALARQVQKSIVDRNAPRQFRRP